MPSKIIQGLIQEGFRYLTEEEKERNCEVGKIDVSKKLKVGVEYPVGSSGYKVTTVFEEKGYEGESDWSLTKEGKEFPASTSKEEIIEYVTGDGPSAPEY